MTADRLPAQVPENQLYDVYTVIDATGKIDESLSLDWIIADVGEEDGGFQLDLRRIISRIQKIIGIVLVSEKPISQTFLLFSLIQLLFQPRHLIKEL